MGFRKFLGLLFSIIGLAFVLNVLNELPLEIRLQAKFGAVYRANHNWWDMYTFRVVSGIYLLIIGFGLFSNKKWSQHPVIALLLPVATLLTLKIFSVLKMHEDWYSLRAFAALFVLASIWCLILFISLRDTGLLFKNKSTNS